MSAQQNLVLNGSFEDTVRCPYNIAQMYNAKYFSAPTDATPDYFNSCASLLSLTSTPYNAFGYQLARTGNAYAGIIPFSLAFIAREYIQASLVSTLEKNKFYAVEYYVCLGHFSRAACNNLGVYFSANTTSVSITDVLHYTDALSNINIINDTINWVKVKFVYKAKGNENFLIIGNFKNDDETNIITLEELGDVYYYIDDISVIETSYQLPNVFTPNNDGINDVFNIDANFIEATRLSIYNRWGRIVYDSNTNFSWNGNTKQQIPCNDGTYYYVVQTETETYKGFLEILR